MASWVHVGSMEDQWFSKGGERVGQIVGSKDPEAGEAGVKE